MTLAEYLDFINLTPSQFARAIGFPSEAVRRYVKGERMPAPPIILQLERITKGQVTATDLARAHRHMRKQRGLPNRRLSVGKHKPKPVTRIRLRRVAAE
jgi:plasmid maintenance system antidote protein VapI